MNSACQGSMKETDLCGFWGMASTYWWKSWKSLKIQAGKHFIYSFIYFGRGKNKTKQNIQQCFCLSKLSELSTLY